MIDYDKLTDEEWAVIRQEQNVIDLPVGRPSSWSGIKARLVAYRNMWLEEHEDNKALTEIAVTQAIDKYIHVITLPNGHIAVYDPEKGYYHKSVGFLKKATHILEPTFTEAKLKNVIFQLSSKDRKYETNGILSDFEPEYLDTKRFILVKNGIFDKTRQTLFPFDYKFINFSTIETRYIEGAKSPNFDGWTVDDWLLDLMSGDEELVELLWQVISASLNGNYNYRQSIWLYGKGNDGKGTFQQLITNLVGMNNVASLKLNQFSERFALSGIEGKTVIIGDDVQAGIYVDDSSNFNSIVTGEPVLVEDKGKPAYTTVFKKTVIQSTNGLPLFKNKSNGTNRRFCIIPFEKTFSPKDDNWKIKDEYIRRKEVLEYVLYKAININFDRFSQPKKVVDMLNEFKQENNTVLQFIEDFFPVKSKRLPVKFIWANYQWWCRENNITPMKKRAFLKQFEENVDGWTKSDKQMKVAGQFHPVEDALEGTIFQWTDKEIKSVHVMFVKQ